MYQVVFCLIPYGEPCLYAESFRDRPSAQRAADELCRGATPLVAAVVEQLPMIRTGTARACVLER